MSTSEPVSWLDRIDPYALYREALQKSLFSATVLTYIYWLFRPANFSAFVSPVIIIYLYETQNGRNFEEKDKALLFAFAAIIFGSITFYLIYPFRFFFLYYAIFYLALIYGLVDKYFPNFKNATMLIIAISTVNVTYQPPANLEGAYEILTTSLISMGTMFACAKLYPNRYLTVWLHAFRLFMICLEQHIDAAIHGRELPDYEEEIPHLTLMRFYQRLIPKPYVRPMYQLSTYMRNLEFALNNVCDEDMNPNFWRRIKRQLRALRFSMIRKKPHRLPDIDSFAATTKLQHLVVGYITRASACWNTICNTYHC